VEDLADAHVRALDRTIPSDIYNLGTNRGYSNLEVIRTAAQITGVNIPMLHGPKREGDPAVLTADSTKFMSTSGWQPKFNMTDIVNHVWAWYNQ
jgi:UDP-glucose 4-epimerase